MALTLTTTQRGYGQNHKNTRRMWKPRVDAGHVACPKCGRAITPRPWLTGDGWDLGHTTDRTAYTGPEHTECNRKHGSKIGHLRRWGKPRRAVTASRWLSPVPRKNRICEICGCRYDASSREQRTCGRACGAELQRRNRPSTEAKPVKPVKPPCSECGSELPSGRRVVCSDVCLINRNRIRNRDAYRNRTGQYKYVPVY